MAINLDLVGKPFDPVFYEYTHKDTILYALGVGATVKDVDFLYEGRGPLVYPGFGVVPSAQLEGGGDWIGDLGINPFMIVHGEQHLRLHRPIPSAGKIESVSMIENIYDKGSGALVELLTKSSIDGEPIFENLIKFFVREEGGFGGDRGPKTVNVETPDRPADFQVDVQTEERQALLYRLCGDMNPIHADPDLAAGIGFKGCILHGLCTFGIMARAVVHEVCDGDPARVRGIGARFAEVVYPGQLLNISMWKEDGRVIAVPTNEDGVAVLTNAVVEID